tara:strand:+ start:236 stop:832 length:597 start_codon:yes stop_codon:yes gene_type:complete
MRDNKKYMKEYREKNKEKAAATNKAWREKNKEKVKEYQQSWCEENNERLREYQKEYRSRLDKDATAAYQREYKQDNKDKRNESERNRRLNDPEYRLVSNIRSRLRLAINGQDATKDSTTMKLTGCSVDVLISHIESQFTEGMTWDNNNLLGWHVDHIRPCSSFDFTLDGEQEKCFHYTNLQPLWAGDNLRKSDKYEQR